MNRRGAGFTRFAWGVTIYNVFVVLWDVIVRMTGVGFRCLSDWPTCKAGVVPLPPFLETFVATSHRLANGLMFVLTVAMFIWAHRVFREGSRVRRATAFTLVFVLSQTVISALTAMGVLGGGGSPVQRAAMLALNLVNTFGYVGFGALTAWWSAPRPAPRRFNDAPPRWIFSVAVVGLIVAGMTGAVTALGDSILPISPTAGDGLLARVRAHLTLAEHFLVRLRILHPMLSVIVGFYLLGMGFFLVRTCRDALLRQFSEIVMGLVAVQLAVGVLNVALRGPGWMQVAHLFLSISLWIALLILMVESSGTELAREDEGEPGAVDEELGEA